MGHTRGVGSVREAITVRTYGRRSYRLVLEDLRRSARRRERACRMACRVCSLERISSLCDAFDCYCAEFFELREHYACMIYYLAEDWAIYIAVRKGATADELVDAVRDTATIVNARRALNDLEQVECYYDACENVKDALRQLLVLRELLGDGP